MSSEAWRLLSCQDWAGRPREMTVRMGPDLVVVLVVPPGEMAGLGLEAAEALWYTLGTAIGADRMR